MQSVGGYFRSWFGRFERLTLRRPDPWLGVPAGALLVLGLLMVLNTTYFLGQEKTGDGFHFFKLQLAHILAGLAVCVLLSQFSLAGLRRMAIPLAVVAVVMLLMVWVPGLGVVRGGARRWVHVGPVLFEPSELAKLSLVFFLAKFLAKRQDALRTFATGPLPAFILVAPITLLTIRQPDFGATVMVVLILFAMLYAAGTRARHLALPGGVALVILALQAVAKPYRLRRFAGFLDPWRTARGAGFQLIQSFIALGAGGGWGQGLGVGRQKMFYLPQAHTDFVFAVVTEEFGLIGAFFVLDPVRRDPLARDVDRARGTRSVREPARHRPDDAAHAAGAHQHGGGDRAGADQGSAAALSQLRRNLDDNYAGGAGRAVGPFATPGGAMKVIIAGGGTGGHLFPAVAVGAEIRRQSPASAVLYVGATNGLEARWLPAQGLPHELLRVRGWTGKDPLTRLRAVGEFAAAVRRARTVIRDFGANLVVGAGGYASAPVALAAILMRIPLILLEQNVRPGISNRILWRLARKVCVGFPDSAAAFAPAKVVVTGNPVRYELPVRPVPDPSGPLQILVLGGSSGAHRLNIRCPESFQNLGKKCYKIDPIRRARPTWGW